MISLVIPRIIKDIYGWEMFDCLQRVRRKEKEFNKQGRIRLRSSSGKIIIAAKGLFTGTKYGANWIS
jgi:archaeosine-15-forming tRNA-guanine transglycosylase